MISFECKSFALFFCHYTVNLNGWSFEMTMASAKNGSFAISHTADSTHTWRSKGYSKSFLPLTLIATKWMIPDKTETSKTQFEI